MKGFLEGDKCFSTVKHKIGSAFNTDGLERDTIDVNEARSAFDFEIRKFQSCTEDGRPIPKNWHLRRSDTDYIIPTRGLGDEFRPVQHLQVFDYIVNDIMPEVPEMKLETVGTMHGGGTGIVMAKFGDDFRISGDNSPHESRLFFFNPNGRSSLIMGFTNVRLWCQNQLQAAISTATDSAKKGYGFRIYHTTNAEIGVDHAIESIYAQVGAVNALKARQERLAQVEAKEENLFHLLDKFFPLNRFEEGSRGYTRMVNQRIAVTNQWIDGETSKSFNGNSFSKLFNCFSYIIYNPDRIGEKTDIQQVTYAGMFGNRADKVSAIFKAVEAEAGIRAVA